MKLAAPVSFFHNTLSKEWKPGARLGAHSIMGLFEGTHAFISTATLGLASVAWHSSQSGRARKRAREQSDALVFSVLPDWLECQATLTTLGFHLFWKWAIWYPLCNHQSHGLLSIIIHVVIFIITFIIFKIALITFHNFLGCHLLWGPQIELFYYFLDWQGHIKLFPVNQDIHCTQKC